MVKKYALEQNYPNPFNPSTIINYQLPKESRVILTVFDVLGKEIETIVNEQQAPGQYKVTWNASGKASGVYFCRLIAGDFHDTKKMVILK